MATDMTASMPLSKRASGATGRDLFREVIEISAYRDCERQGRLQSLVKLDGVALTADERELLLERY
jgi:hypothetical protein